MFLERGQAFIYLPCLGCSAVLQGCAHSWTALLFSPQAGGFYSAEDADSYPTATSSEKREGAFCVWAAEEVRALLPDPVEGAAEGTTLGDVFMHHYGVKEDGNVSPRKVRDCADLTGSVAAPKARGSNPCGTGWCS